MLEVILLRGIIENITNDVTSLVMFTRGGGKRVFISKTILVILNMCKIINIHTISISNSPSNFFFFSLTYTLSIFFLLIL